MTKKNHLLYSLVENLRLSLNKVSSYNQLKGHFQINKYMQQIMHVRRVVQSNHCHKNLETPPTDTH